MDEYMEDFIEECYDTSDFDLDYEFDAVRFFDFTRPETFSEAEEAELWFDTIGSYPPSPLIVKLNLRKVIPLETADASPKSKLSQGTSSVSNNSDVHMTSEVCRSDETIKGTNSDNEVAQSILKAKTNVVSKSSKPRSSTLMKPTASHLAKLNRARELYSNRFLRRSKKPLIKVEDRSSQNLGFESLATKRQKLEIGYIWKVAQLKHQTLLLHKASKKVGLVDANSVHSRLKVTIPREPDLETTHRAQRQRSRITSEPGELAESNGHTFKARPLNRKILKAPSLPLRKKSTPQLPQFQVFRLKTSERAMQHSSANAINENNSDYISQNGSTGSRRLNPEDAFKQEKCEAFHKFKACPPSKKENTFPTDKRLLHNPPVELFKKLSLKSELESNTISQPKPHDPTKVLKENAPKSVQQEPWRYGGKHNQCGSDLWIPESGPLSNINRSMDIR